jgi:hypothetical protein
MQLLALIKTLELLVRIARLQYRGPYGPLVTAKSVLFQYVQL